MIGSVKSYLKDVAYRGGMLAAYHRLRNRKSLTVVMFHRVLPRFDPRFQGADPEWTMTPDSFANCLNFFEKHYNIVSPHQAFSAISGRRRLPARSLLVTFDDGWADTEEYAQSILDKFGISALVFVVSNSVNQKNAFWEERIYSSLATCADVAIVLKSVLKQYDMDMEVPEPTAISEQTIKRIIGRIGKIGSAAGVEIADAIAREGEKPAAMLNTEQLRSLNASAHMIGSHGMTHCPLTTTRNINEELTTSRETLSHLLQSPQPIDSISFPHGSYDATVIAESLSAGYKYLFGSVPTLNRLALNASAVGPIGRIHISERAVTDRTGRFLPSALATSLFLRPYSDIPRSRGAK